MVEVCLSVCNKTTGTRTRELRALKLKNNLQIEFETLRWKRNRIHKDRRGFALYIASNFTVYLA